MRRRRPRAARLHHQPPPAPDPLPAPTEPFFKVICAFPGPPNGQVGQTESPQHTGPDDMQTYVLRDLSPEAFAELAGDITAATKRGESLQDVLACWEAIR